MEIKRPNLFLTLFAIPLLLSCADDLKGPAGQDAAATPNVSIRGGGTITYSSSTKQISFTEDIVIKDLARASVYTITPSASPITLANVGDISYVEIKRGSALDETITDTTETQAGSIELKSDNAVAVTLFERSETDVIYIPWVQKELVSGDEWRFGTALSWYERIASQAKPSYKAEAEGTVVIVPGSPEAPAVVIIAGKIYANTAPEPCDLSTGPRGGLDTQTGSSGTPIAENKAYYLYAIPAEEGRSFDLVASATSPKDGSPDGFDQWSYVGAMATNESLAKINTFRSTKGRYMAEQQLREDEHTGQARTPYEQKNLPTTASAAWFKAFVSAGVESNFCIFSPSNTQADSMQVRMQVANVPNPIGPIGMPMLTRNLYLDCSSGSVTVKARLFGWQEDPTAYK